MHRPLLRIYLAGGLALRGAGGATLGERAFPGRQGRRLFVRLAALREPVAQRDLADDLWGRDWPNGWQVALRSLASKLRATLARAGAPNAVVCRDGVYALTLPAGTWLDLDAAHDAIHRAEPALDGGDLSAACGWALAARAIACRPLLPGEEAAWLDDLRLALADVRLRALECLAEVWIRHGDAAQAARDATEALAVDPFRESSHRLLIRARLAAGDRAAAMHAYLACVQLLREELQVPPAPETTELVRPWLRAADLASVDAMSGPAR